MVEVVHLQDVIFRVELVNLVNPELLTLECRQLQHFVVVDSPELRLPVINEVFTLPKVEIDDIDGIDLLDVIIVLTAVDIFRHQL